MGGQVDMRECAVFLVVRLAAMVHKKMIHAKPGRTLPQHSNSNCAQVNFSQKNIRCALLDCCCKSAAKDRFIWSRQICH